MSSVDEKLEFWSKNSLNVIFRGKHGCGKTSMVTQTWNRLNLNWLYFSAATMDPWVDFVGVPREKIENKVPEQFEIIKELASIDLSLAHEWVSSNWKLSSESAQKVVTHALKRQNGLTYLDLVRPEKFASGEVEALFFDEWNRSPSKVRNACMELLQLKSINGFKFPNLKMIWVAVNPDDDEQNEYNVEKIDPAQEDRFHIKVEVPYKPNVDWFRNRYTKEIADAAIEWWNELNEEGKNCVSPRRLQYALDIRMQNGDVRDVLPRKDCINVTKLLTRLTSGKITDKLAELMQSKDPEEARVFLSNENHYDAAMKYIPKSETMMKYFLPLLSKEKLSTIMVDKEYEKMCDYIIVNAIAIPYFRTICKEILSAKLNDRLVKKIRSAATNNEELAKSLAEKSFSETLVISETLVNRPVQLVPTPVSEWL